MANPTPYRQIRANYNSETITVYQAFQSSIADAAVKTQKLSASSDYRRSRMTWIKPSWCWMMYRAGYSYKDERQERILAIKIRHKDFEDILSRGHLTHSKSEPEEVKIQWDPERGPRLERFEYRSIQIGIPGILQDRYVDEWIVGIEDVTERAREMKRVLDENPEITSVELVEMGLMPVERVYAVSDSLRRVLEMDKQDD